MSQSSAAAVDVPLDLGDDPMPRDTRIEQLLEEWNLPFELELQFPLGRLRLDDATQIRSEVHRAPSATVEQYVTHMKHGAKFPPIVIGVNGMLVDGNTRVQACRKLGIKTFPAYKVKFPVLSQAKLIGAAINQMGGARLSDEEIVIAAEAMMAESYADEAIARTLGRSISHVRNVRRDRMFREAAERVGMSHVQVPKHIARALAGIQHDEPFKAAVEIVSRAKPSVKDATTLVNKIEQTRSDAEALAAIRTVETQWGPVTGPPPSPKSLSRNQAKKALVHVQALLEAGEGAPDTLMLPDDMNARELWLRLNVLTTKLLALYPQPS